MAPIRLILYTSKHLSRASFPRQSGILGGRGGLLVCKAASSKQHSLVLPAQVSEKAQKFNLATCSGVSTGAAFTVTKAPPGNGGFS